MSAWGKKVARGMTLMELMVVIAIIGILMGLLIPATMQMRRSAAATRAQEARAALRTAILNYHAKVGQWPIGNQIAIKKEKSSVVIDVLRPKGMWERESAIMDENGEEYSVTINPNGTYPVMPTDDFSSSYSVYFSVP